MYSDKAYIASFFDKYDSWTSRKDVSEAREYLLDDISVLAQVQALIDHGYIELYAPVRNVCFACQVQELLGETAARRFMTQYRPPRQNLWVDLGRETQFESGFSGVFVISGASTI